MVQQKTNHRTELLSACGLVDEIWLPCLTFFYFTTGGSSLSDVQKGFFFPHHLFFCFPFVSFGLECEGRVSESVYEEGPAESRVNEGVS